MIRFLIWDVGGTLFDTYPAVVTAFGRALADYGKAAPPEHVAALARESLGHCTAALAAEFGLDRDDLERRFRGHYAQVPPSEQPVFPGVRELCAYVCTIGANFIFTHRARTSAQALLAAHGLTGYFADLLTTEDGLARKPDPAGLEALIQRHDLPRAEVLVIGDRDIDIQAGQSAGARTAFFNPSFGPTRFPLDQCVASRRRRDSPAAGTRTARPGAASGRVVRLELQAVTCCDYAFADYAELHRLLLAENARIREAPAHTSDSSIRPFVHSVEVSPR